MPDWMVTSLTRSGLWFAGCLVGFSLLAMLFSARPGQKFWRRDSLTDALYWFVSPLVFTRIELAFVSLGLLLVYGNVDAAIHAVEHGYGPVAQWPLPVQFLAVLVISDVLQYWLHRMFHRGVWWRFHTIHHSSRELDWLSAVRFHPMNQLVAFTLVGALVTMLGFVPLVFAILAPFNILYSTMVHANLNWTFGPLRYVFASPVFHRWHHSALLEGRDKNFAPTFPVLDVMFGTFYMPEGRFPGDLGINTEQVPQSFWAQMAYPFRKNT